MTSKINIKDLKNAIEDTIGDDEVRFYGAYEGRNGIKGVAIVVEEYGNLLAVGARLAHEAEFSKLLEGFCNFDSLGYRIICTWHESLFDMDTLPDPAPEEEEDEENYIYTYDYNRDED